MIFYLLQNHGFGHDVQTMIQVYYPNEHYYAVQEVAQEGLTVVSALLAQGAWACIYENGVAQEEGEEAFLEASPSLREQKRAMKGALAKALSARTGYHPLWGLITGIRPTKMVNELLDEGWTVNQAARMLREEYHVSKEKTDLTLQVAQAERNILAQTKPDSYSIYMGIPFCPTRCLYCSFTSYPLTRYRDRVDAYLDLLEREMDFLAAYLRHKKPMTVYIGGGTPTSLTAKQLQRLLAALQVRFDLSDCVEFTVEAGRPDTITKEKLWVLRQGGVSRVSINPQTMNDETLRLIGRSHTAAQVVEAFAWARKAGFTNINMDLILGLPGEEVGDVARTLQQVQQLAPKSLTVHTLAIKRASRLKEEFSSFVLTDVARMEEMLSLSHRTAEQMGLLPYYMYRQKNMVGNFENVGYCRPGTESVYNVEIMEEKQTIFGLGAGTTTKLYEAEKNRISRVFNVKSIEEYTSRFDEMLERKKAAFIASSLPMILPIVD